MSDASAQHSRLWSFDRRTECDSIDRNVRTEASRSICYAVVDSVLDIRENRDVVRHEHVAAFIRAAEAAQEYVFCLGGRRLVQCSHFSPVAAEGLRTLSRHSRWRPRFNLMCVLHYRPPDSLVRELLATGLADENERVACRAASACDALREVPGVKRIVDERLATETRPQVRDELEFVVGLMNTPEMREGHRLVRNYRGVRFVRDVPRENSSDAKSP